MRRPFIVCFYFLLQISFLHAIAQPEQRKNEFNVSSTTLALDGYDPVAYFRSNKAMKGDKQQAHIYAGIRYHFVSAQNLELFKSNPSMYEPQYGGWCAYAMGDSGEKVEVDPKTFKIVDGKLYLFYNRYFTNTLKYWNKDEVNLKARADKNWNKIFN